MMQPEQYRCGEDPCATMLPGETEVRVGPNDCRVRADVTLRRMRSVLIWGTVTDPRGWPVPGALVKLLRHTGEGRGGFAEVSRTRTDGRGEYQFDLNGESAGQYRVLVSPCVHDRGGYAEDPPARESYPPQEEDFRSFSIPREPRNGGVNCVQYY